MGFRIFIIIQTVDYFSFSSISIIFKEIRVIHRILKYFTVRYPVLAIGIGSQVLN